MAATILGIGRAPGKVILFGEHAVVYGRPALAVPVTQAQAEAIVETGVPGTGLVIWAADLSEEIIVRTASANQPLATAARLTLAKLALPEPDWRVTIHSTIPIASGLGSGAAVSAAIVRAVAEAAHRSQGSGVRGQESGDSQFPASSLQLPTSNFQLPTSDVSALIYEVEKLHHGTPSGVDNTVIAFGRPVYFVRGQIPQPFVIGKPFTLAIADTGIHSPTKVAVGDVRRAWQAAPQHFEAWFDQIAVIVDAARIAIASGKPDGLGPLLDANHTLLQQIGVSCPELDALAAAARSAGALGAKLSGAGRGGNLIALVTQETAQRVADALAAAGAVRVIVTEVGCSAQPSESNALAEPEKPPQRLTTSRCACG